MFELEQYLHQKVKSINQDEARKERLRDWIDGYRGKIICLVSPSAAIHLVFTRDGVDIRPGSYPSCEVTYRGSEEALLRVLRGEGGASSEVRGGRLKVWGSLNEAMRFEAIL